MKKNHFIAIIYFLLFPLFALCAEIDESITELEKGNKNHIIQIEDVLAEDTDIRLQNRYHEHQKEEIDKEEEQSKCCSFSTIKNVGVRIIKSNNRSLGTLFGCISGGIVATILVSTDAPGSFQIFGDPSSLPVIYKVGGILLSIGVGGNLSSYIGGSIDIITGDKTIFDAIKYIVGYCHKESEVPNE